MSIIKTALVAVSFIVVAATANAQGREDLETGIHGNTVAQNSSGPAISGEARGAFARSGAVRIRMQDANPLFDNFHGN